MDFNTSVAPPSTQFANLGSGGAGPSYLEVAGQVGALKAQKQQLATGQLQQTALDQENQQRAIDLQDQATLRQLLPQMLNDPKYASTTGGASGQASSPDFAKILPDLAGKVSPKAVFSLQQTMLGNDEKRASTLKALADADEANSKVKQAEIDHFGGIAGKIAAGGYDPVATEAMLIGAEQMNPSYAPHAEAVRQLIAKDPSNLKQVIDGMIAQSQKATQEQREQATAAAANKKTTLETGLMQNKLDFAKRLMTEPGLVEQTVAGVVDPQKYPDIYKRTVSTAKLAAAQGQDVQAAIDKGGEAATAIEKETNPDVMAARTKQALMTETALNPLKLAQQLAVAKAMRAGDNPAVQGVAPAAINEVQNKAISLDQQAVKAKSATEQLGKILDLAESGNKAAGKNVPLVSVETLNAINGIKRINSAEITQNSNLGTLYDQVVGKMKGWTEGQPIPQDVLKDVRALHQALGTQGYQEYTDGLNALNTRTGAQFKPAVGPPNIRGKITVVAPDGSAHPFDNQAQADAFKKLANIK